MLRKLSWVCLHWKLGSFGSLGSFPQPVISQYNSNDNNNIYFLINYIKLKIVLHVYCGSTFHFLAKLQTWLFNLSRQRLKIAKKLKIEHKIEYKIKFKTSNLELKTKKSNQNIESHIKSKNRTYQLRKQPYRKTNNKKPKFWGLLIT